MLLSPSGLIESLTREVIERKPEEFKIACLGDLRSLWPEKHNPFYAGFGNRDSDVVSYREVGVPQSRIMVINPQGEIRLGLGTYCWASYPKLVELSHQMFPFLKPDEHSDEEDFTAFNFWRTPPPPLPPDLNDLHGGNSVTSLRDIGGGSCGHPMMSSPPKQPGQPYLPLAPLLASDEPRVSVRTASLSSMPGIDDID